jgi:hypothetical protein
MEEDVRFAVDSFNRFRRPDVEARIAKIESTMIIIEFAGGLEQIDYYINFFKDKLQSVLDTDVKLESLDKGKTSVAQFSIRKIKKEDDDPLQKALKMVDKYYEGAPASKFGIED